MVSNDFFKLWISFCYISFHSINKKMIQVFFFEWEMSCCRSELNRYFKYFFYKIIILKILLDAWNYTNCSYCDISYSFNGVKMHSNILWWFMVSVVECHFAIWGLVKLSQMNMLDFCRFGLAHEPLWTWITKLYGPVTA